MSHRDLIRDLISDKPKPMFDGRCSYCGERCYGNACPDHRDLVQIENEEIVSPSRLGPTLDRVQTTERAASPTRDSATRSDRKER